MSSQTVIAPESSKSFGLSPAQFAATSERSIVCMDINALGHSGPWAERPGYDQIAQAATGFAAKEGEPNKPKVSPVFYLGDPITGDFAVRHDGSGCFDGRLKADPIM